ncbi:unnamed protein product [Amoebophrya sp. A25]|nr:unnamed protein product [Amoebophrya sp. A25]|eukprot:GSA25T00011331001.1
MDSKVFIDLLAKRSESKFEQLPEKITSTMPKKEPTYDPALGVIYRVLEPYYTRQAVDDVMQAMLAGEVSSGTQWPRRMAEQICKLYSVPVAMPTSSGASALHVSLLCIGVYGFEVIVPAFTMVAVSNAVKLAGAIPVFADSAPDNLNPGLAELKSKKTVRTKAVIICHTYGIVCPDIREIAEWCKEEKIQLIEDICESMGARVGMHPKPEDPSTGRYLLAGAFGDFSCSSLYANKQITAGDGGWVHSTHPGQAGRLKSLINHGFDPAFHFLHFETAPNAKINGLGAAFINSQLGEALHEQIDQRHRVAQWYRSALYAAGLTGFAPSATSSMEVEQDDRQDGEGSGTGGSATPPAGTSATDAKTTDVRRGGPTASPVPGRCGSQFPLKGIDEAYAGTCFFDAPWVFGIECWDRITRDNLRQYLAECGVETRNYFFPLHVQPVMYYEYAQGVAGSYASWESELPNSLRFATCGLYLPTHSYLKLTDVEFIVGCCKKFYQNPAGGAAGQGESSVKGSGEACTPEKPQRAKGWVDRVRSEMFQKS